MADSKKISELSKTTGLSNDDEFIVVDKSVKTGADASSTGRTSKIRFDDLKDQIGSQGQKGEKGQPGNSITGPEGQKGQKGDFQKGQKGEQGQSITGPQGDKGQKGQKGDFQKGQKGDFQKGDKGQKGDFQKGQKGDKGPYDSYAMSKQMFHEENVLVGKNTTSMYKITGKNGSWDAYACTNASYFKGATITFKIYQETYESKPIFMVGFCEKPTTVADHSDLAYAMYYHGANNKLYFRKGTSTIGDVTLPTNGGVFTMVYYNTTVRIYVDSKLVHTFSGDNIDKKYYGKVTIYSPTDARKKADSSLYLPILSNFYFGAVAIPGTPGQKGQKGQKGDSQTGQKGQKGDFQKGQKGDFQKGQKGDKGPRGITFKYDSTTKYLYITT